MLTLAAALKVNRSVRQLLIELDAENREGASAIANALRSNTTITELSLGDNTVDEGVLAAVNGTIRVNKFITTIGSSSSAVSPNEQPSPSVASETLSPLARSFQVATPVVTAQPPSRSPQKVVKSPQHSPQRSVLVASSMASLGVVMGPAKASTATAPPSSGSSRRTGVRSAVNGSAAARDEGAMLGWNKRLEQLAAAMEVRLQAQEAQIIRLANELNTVSSHNMELRAKVDELSTRLEQSDSETGTLKEAVEAERERREQLAQELRWVDEAGTQARSEEEEERRRADEMATEHREALQQEVRRVQSSVEAFEEASRKATAELHRQMTEGLKEAAERTDAATAAARDESDRLRAELAEVGASAELSAEVSELTRTVEANQQKLQEEVRWLDEEHMRCRAEDEGKVQAVADGLRVEMGTLEGALQDAVAGLRRDLGAQVELLGSQLQSVGEVLAPPGEDTGALQTFRQTAARVSELSEAVGRLCGCMESIKANEVTAAAEDRAAKLETRMSHGQQQAQQGLIVLASRVDDLEAALTKEQESSLKALQALLQSAKSSQ